MPDTLDAQDNDTGAIDTFTVIQIWVDPANKYAFRERPMRDYIERRAAEGVATLIRWNESEGLVVFCGAITGGQWIEQGGTAMAERHPEETLHKLASSARFSARPVKA